MNPNSLSLILKVLALSILLPSASCHKQSRSQLQKGGATLTIKNDSLLLLQSIDSSGMKVFEVYVHEISNTKIRKREVYFPDGKPAKIEYFDRRGQLNGLRREYYENGNISTEEHFENGVKNGRFRYFYPNGQIYWSTNFEDGKAHGGDTVWTQEGFVKELYRFDHDRFVDTGFVFGVGGKDSIHYYFRNGEKIDSLVFNR